jgi:hypothetical protein
MEPQTMRKNMKDVSHVSFDEPRSLSVTPTVQTGGSLTGGMWSGGIWKGGIFNAGGTAVGSMGSAKETHTKIPRFCSRCGAPMRLAKQSYHEFDDQHGLPIEMHQIWECHWWTPWRHLRVKYIGRWIWKFGWTGHDRYIVRASINYKDKEPQWKVYSRELL